MNRKRLSLACIHSLTPIMFQAYFVNEYLYPFIAMPFLALWLRVNKARVLSHLSGSLYSIFHYIIEGVSLKNPGLIASKYESREVQRWKKIHARWLSWESPRLLYGFLNKYGRFWNNLCQIKLYNMLEVIYIWQIKN